jgi:hypothetical protein
MKGFPDGSTAYVADARNNLLQVANLNSKADAQLRLQRKHSAE